MSRFPLVQLFHMRVDAIRDAGVRECEIPIASLCIEEICVQY
jgi:hypothetical protein